MQIIEINNQEVRFDIVDGQTFASSRDIGKVFEKEHKHILEKIREMPQDEFGRSNFGQSSYLNEQNKEQPMYNLTRDGFSMLVMGFTGEKAYQWKVKFIEAFNLLEQKHISNPNDDFYKDKYIELLERNNILLQKSYDNKQQQKRQPSPQKQGFRSGENNNEQWTQENDDTVISMKKAGNRASKIADKLGRTVFAVSARIARLRKEKNL